MMKNNQSWSINMSQGIPQHSHLPYQSTNLRNEPNETVSGRNPLGTPFHMEQNIHMNTVISQLGLSVVRYRKKMAEKYEMQQAGVVTQFTHIT